MHLLGKVAVRHNCMNVEKKTGLLQHDDARRVLRPIELKKTIPVKGRIKFHLLTNHWPPAIRIGRLGIVDGLEVLHKDASMIQLH